MIAELLECLLVLKIFLWLASCNDVSPEMSTQMDGALRDLLVGVSRHADGPDFPEIFRGSPDYNRQMDENVDVERRTSAWSEF